MSGILVGNITRTVRTVSPDEPIAKVADILRASGLSELPVVKNGRLVGMVSEAAILEAFVADDKLAGGGTAGAVMSRDFTCVNRFMTVHQVAEIMSDGQISVLPVIDENGSFLGVVSRSDVTAALGLGIRPPVVAGLATPLGVYLTSGNFRAGVGDLGLILAGAAIILMNELAVAVVYGLLWLVDATGVFGPWSLQAIFLSPPIGVYNWMDAVATAMRILAMLIFLLFLRLLPLSGYHGAEHQVVHAIETGEELTLESVRRMPRVHPRCGTNIVAAIVLFLMVANIFSNDIAALIAIFVLIFAWRSVGGYFQYFITTKTPSEKQLRNGILAGEELLRNYRKDPGRRVTVAQRIWNMGMPQVLIGLVIVLLIEQALARVGLLPPWISPF